MSNDEQPRCWSLADTKYGCLYATAHFLRPMAASRRRQACALHAHLIDVPRNVMEAGRHLRRLCISRPARPPMISSDRTFVRWTLHLTL
jgi:hypothetical protein